MTRANKSTSTPSGVSTTTPMLDPQSLDELVAAVNLEQGQRNQFIRAEIALKAAEQARVEIFQKLQRLYDLGPQDTIDTRRGIITRVPV